MKILFPLHDSVPPTVSEKALPDGVCLNKGGCKESRALLEKAGKSEAIPT